MVQDKNVDIKGLAAIVRSTYAAINEAKQILDEAGVINRGVREFTATARRLQEDFDRAFARRGPD